MAKNLSKFDNNQINLTMATQVMRNFLTVEQFDGNRMIGLLQGPPGQGKTAIVEQLVATLNLERDQLVAKALGEGMTLEAAEEKYPAWTDRSFRLSQCDPTDLKGVPVYSEVDGMEFTSWAAPGVMPVVGSKNSAGGKNVVIFLDELRQATPTMQNLAANIIDGKVGDHVIDVNRTLIVAAANRQEDMAATYEMPRNVGNRMCHLTVMADFSEWEVWAVAKGLNPFVIGYLKDHVSLYNMPPNEDSPIFPTPRTWHKVSSYLNAMGDKAYEQEGLTLTVIQGYVGGGVAHDFWQFCKMARKEYSVTAIMEGKKIPVPAGKKDIIFALAVEGTQKLNNWAEALVKSPNYAANMASDPNAAVVKGLGKEKVDGINNLYAWFDQDGVDPAFAVLLNRYQSETCRGVLRSAMMIAPEFAPAKKGYAKIHAALKVTK